LICLQAHEKEIEGLRGDSRFYDDDLGFTTAIAFKPIEEEEGKKRFGHLRLA
jgi:hypothetical protein